MKKRYLKYTKFTAKTSKKWLSVVLGGAYIYIYIYIYSVYIYNIYCVYIYIFCVYIVYILYIYCIDILYIYTMYTIYIYTVHIYIYRLYIYIYRLYIYIHIYLYWLVVSTPLKNMKVSWDAYSQYRETNVSKHQSALLVTSGVLDLSLDLSLHGVHLFPTTPATTGPVWIPIFTSTETGMDHQGSSSMAPKECTKGMW